jgi:aminoglycoside phosphotransferase (APT) family kinase protein
MLELNADNLLDYLRRRGWLGDEPARVEPLGGGVSNVVLRVETPRRAFVVKQSRPQLRTRDAWFSDLDRIHREQEVMQLLQPLLPPPTVPEVLFTDRDNYAFAMSHAPQGARPWKEALLAGEADSALAEHAGLILRRMHERTAHDAEACSQFRDRTVFVQLRVDPFYRRVQERRPEVADAVEPLIRHMLTAEESLCHGDYTPKNMLALGHEFTLVDYETAHFGDPAMDLGLFLAHLVLKAARLPARRWDYLFLVMYFWGHYAKDLRFVPLDELQRRAIGHLGVCLLARVDGTSPVEYLPEESKRAAVRRLANRLLLQPPKWIADVLQLADEELAHLA